MKKKTVWFILILAFVLCGCGNRAEHGRAERNESIPRATVEKEERQVKPKSEFSQETETVAETDGKTDLVNTEDEEKLYQTYIDIFNGIADHFDQMILSYFCFVDFQEEFTLLGEGYACLGGAEQFYKDLDTANELLEKKQGKSELDQVYQRLEPVMREMAETFDLISVYAEEKRFEEDDYEKGKAYHAVIWRNYEKYLDLRNEFIARLADEVQIHQEEMLELFQTKGYEGSFALTKAVITMKEVQNAIYEQVRDDTQMLELDIDGLQPLYDQYMGEIESCMIYLENEELMAREGYPVDSEEYRVMKNAFQESGEALEALFERVRRGEEMSAVDSAFAAEGSVTKFDEAVERSIYYYDQFIRQVNAN